jgi:hypothetical protein
VTESVGQFRDRHFDMHDNAHRCEANPLIPAFSPLGRGKGDGTAF